MNYLIDLIDMAGEETTNVSNIKTNYNAAQLGLDMDSSVVQVKKGKLTYALNANIENFDSNSVNYQNEEGNELCLNFPSGYVVIGKHYIQEKYKHIFFLVNPNTGGSEIGYMDNNDCTYTTLLNNNCLNFNINYPIHKIVHRITNCETEIYWTDGYNERRYLDLDNVPTGSDICNKLSLQPNFTIPQIDIVSTVIGGNLTSGTYQFAIQYCDAKGFGYTSFYSVTNPVSIADSDITTSDFSYPVNKSIQLSISNLETSGYYSYYNLAVIKTVNSITSVELVGTYYIETSQKTYTYSGQNSTQIRLTIEDIFEKYPYYNVAKDVTSVQDVIIWDNLVTADRINYQKIAAQISLEWQTYKISKDKNYSDPLNTALLRGYLRDEVYAFEIVFLLKNGQQTDSFHIPGRVADSTDLQSISNSNNDYIGSGSSSPRWKIYNTATDLGTATGVPINGAVPHRYGKFSYWESEETYPANSVFTEAGLTGQIRHHKFPDVLVSPIFESLTYSTSGTITPIIETSNAIYPIGVKVNTQQVWDVIQASTLTQEQKDNIVGFKIVRGSRSTNKSIVAKGIVRNVGKYKRQGTTYYYPNYPYNDLNTDPFLLDVNENDSSKAYKYIKQAYTYYIYQVTTGGSVSYTDCMTGQVKEKAYDAGGGGYLCSLTVPVLNGSMVATITKPLSTAVSIRVKPTGGDLTLNIGSPTVSNSRTSITFPADVVSYAMVNGATYINYVSGTTNYTVEKTDLIDPQCLCSNLNPQFESSRMVFNSPETSFGTPTLGNILKMESVIFGGGNAHFVQVEKNAKYKFITRSAQTEALDSSYALAKATGTFDPLAMMTTYQSYLQIYINGITRRNYAYSFNSVANYNYHQGVLNAGQKQRELDIYQYLIPGVQSVSDLHDVNNYQRESSVYLKTIDDISFASISGNNFSEKSRFTCSEKGNCSTPEKLENIQVLSYYASIKNIVPSQYGQIYSYETIDTGFQFDFSSQLGVKTIFGGDTFICQFSFKTKLPFFIDNRVGAQDDSDVFYDELGNIAYPKYWHSSRSILSNYVKDNVNLQNVISIKSTWLDCPNDPPFQSSGTTNTTTTSANNFVAPPLSSYYDGKMYMFAYGIPNFYCESSINLDLRQATNNKEGDFYPHVSSGIPDNWLQQYNVPIAQDNTYNYNITFSKQNSENYFSHLPFDWDGSQCNTYFPFRAIYSDPQVSDPTSKVNNWLIYKPISFYDFPQSYGNLISLDGIQNKAILARFENKSLLYNNLLTIDTSNPQAAYIGNPTLFKGAPPIDFAETDLGYVGSQHKLLLKIPQGQVSVDAKRGQIFILSGGQAVDITQFGSGINRFMTDHLAFEILRYYPEVDVDNSYKGLGLTGVYDSKYDRVIITKLDYIPQPNLISGLSYDTATKEFKYNGSVVSLTDQNYFCNKSWTLSFNVNSKSWVSFHSYIPNYYIGDNNFFYSGLLNNGLWRHLTNTLLNNNYYGTIHPYIIEYPFAFTYQDEIVQNVKDYTKVYQYLPIPDGVFNDNAKVLTNDYYFNKAIIYNSQQNSGLLELVKKPKNDLSQYGKYPIYNESSKTITFTKSDSFYQYNTFWSVYSDKTKPMFTTSCQSLSIDKVLNNSVMDYGTRSFKKEPIRAKDLLIRHILDNKSDLHLVSQFIIVPTQISYK